MLNVTYDECHIKAPFAECHYAECRYAECRYAECCDAIYNTYVLYRNHAGTSLSAYLLKPYHNVY
jgi:hypothetical protein